MIAMTNSVNVFPRHESDHSKLVLQFMQDLLRARATGRMAFQYGTYFFLLPQIFCLLILKLVMLRTTLLEKVIAGILKFLEHFLAEFLRDRSNILPLQLQAFQFIGCLFPITA